MEELTPSTSRHCDKCGSNIKPDERAMGFHGEEDGQEYETYLCESCIAIIYDEHLREMDLSG